MTGGGRLRSLTTRLLASVLAITVVSVAASAWVANRQSKQAFQDSLRHELAKPTAILDALREWAVTHPDWTDVEQHARTLSYITGLRITLTMDDDPDADFGVIDVDERHPERLSDPAPAPLYRVDPAEESAEALEAFTADNISLRTCYIANDIFYIDEQLPFGLSRPVASDDRSAEGRNCRRLYEAERNEPYKPLRVALSESELETGSFLANGLSWRLVGIVAGLLLLAAGTTTLAARRVLGPVGRLTAAVRRMQGGNLAERVTVTSQDELGELSLAFNSMASSLQQADQLRRRLTSDIAHELRTPLSNIRGYLEAAQDGVAPLTAALIDSLHEDTLLLQALVDDLQELTQAEAGQLRLELAPTDLGDLLASVADAHRTRAAALGIVVDVELDAPGLGQVDARRIRQVITNLVENAIRHTPPGGSITLRATKSAGELELSVADTGAGIAPEHLAHLFERFYRVDNSRNRTTGGSGLGLAITRELVTAHGGTITVSSAPRLGTTFRVVLPLAGPGQAPEVAARRDRHDHVRPASATSLDEHGEAFDEFHVHVS